MKTSDGMILEFLLSPPWLSRMTEINAILTPLLFVLLPRFENITITLTIMINNLFFIASFSEYVPPVPVDMLVTDTPNDFTQMRISWNISEQLEGTFSGNRHAS